MLGEPDLDGAVHQFLAEQRFAVLTARDDDGLLWTSPLVGPAGFLDGHGTSLEIRAVPGPADPLAGLSASQPVGMLAIDFAGRRRLRVNGMLTVADRDRLAVTVDQAYGNCRRYITPRPLGPVASDRHPPGVRRARSGTHLDANQQQVVVAADTFFLGTIHLTRGADASHRGGPRGFVHVDEKALWWPDYPGNNMFNSLGNLEVDPTASLLFIDWATATTLYLSGTAVVEWRPGQVRGAQRDTGGTGRQVRFTPIRVVETVPASAGG